MEVILMNEEKFYAKIREVGTSSVITVPSTIMKYGSIENGDNVEVIVKKLK